jgi:hypothetical protein
MREGAPAHPSDELSMTGGRMIALLAWEVMSSSPDFTSLTLFAGEAGGDSAVTLAARRSFCRRTSPTLQSL